MKVAVAIITDEQQRILVTQRPFHVPHGGCWEFPGGKLEQDESPEAALVREIKEEVGLTVLNSRYLGEIKHQYSDKTVQLILFHVTHFIGNPCCNEGQLDMKWVYKDDLNPEDFPQANIGIINLIQLSESIA
ncbi:8-oxo-dGTP diphosphatase MutT [Legionella quateirensis]|uniref:8-oxo-dGTP diphosphatase n=1 Tax=Legionella quateirensis TaxID=45072 RepID=A0A378KWF6_9GAMM|nr:8-oxo-dGTP diphosphatase MutT [Legionella quateirensis]KTD50824.1 Mutator protein MutT [Legionella quateirensis]STY17931.1 mutator MutT protein [Legionella quateirensis]